MRKLRFVYFFFSFLLISSCKQKKELIIEDYQIINRNFNFQNQSISIFKQNTTIKESNDFKLFIYKTLINNNDSLKILKNDKVFYKGILLKKIDSKWFKINNLDFKLSKYYYGNKKNYQADCYLFINNEDGILFIESLNFGTMTEYNIKKFNKIHKAIALKKLGFKDGPFELQFAKMNYPDLKN